MNTPEARKRLADAMEARRLGLGLTWREVAAAGGLSYEAVRAARNDFSRDLRPLTVAGIARGLRWTPDSVQRIFKGHDPVPLEAAAAEAPAAEPRLLQSPARARIRRTATIQAIAAQVRREVADARSRNPAATAEDIFSDPDEVRIWGTEGVPEETRVDDIVVLRIAAQVRHEVEAARKVNPAATAEDIFGGPDGDPDEVYVWSLEGMNEETRADHIAVLRREVAREEDERRQHRKRAG